MKIASHPTCMFFCKHCNENRLGKITNQNATFDQKEIVRTICCCTCNNWENDCTKLIPNEHNPKREPVDITGGDE